jgi:hypothetical protein
MVYSILEVSWIWPLKKGQMEALISANRQKQFRNLLFDDSNLGFR